MAEITVDYLGGEPDTPSAPLKGTLGFVGGAFTFVGKFMTADLKTTEIAFDFTEAEVRAVSFGDANHMRGLTRGATGLLLGGAIGGLIGVLTGKRNMILAVACEREGFEFAPAFGCTADDGRWFVNEVQRARRDRGLEAIPKIEDLYAQAAAAAADGQAAIIGAGPGAARATDGAAPAVGRTPLVRALRGDRD